MNREKQYSKLEKLASNRKLKCFHCDTMLNVEEIRREICGENDVPEDPNRPCVISIYRCFNCNRNTEITTWMKV